MQLKVLQAREACLILVLAEPGLKKRFQKKGAGTLACQAGFHPQPHSTFGRKSIILLLYRQILPLLVQPFRSSQEMDQTRSSQVLPKKRLLQHPSVI